MTEPTKDTEETVESQEQDSSAEKTFTQSEVNALLAKERRSHTIKLNSLQEQFDQFRQEISDRESALETKAKEKVGELRKDLPEQISKLLDKLTYQEQLEWLSDPANKVEKKTIPALPDATKGQPQAPRQYRPGL